MADTTMRTPNELSILATLRSASLLSATLFGVAGCGTLGGPADRAPLTTVSAGGQVAEAAKASLAPSTTEEKTPASENNVAEIVPAAQFKSSSQIEPAESQPVSRSISSPAVNSGNSVTTNSLTTSPTVVPVAYQTPPEPPAASNAASTTSTNLTATTRLPSTASESANIETAASKTTAQLAGHRIARRGLACSGACQSEEACNCEPSIAGDGPRGPYSDAQEYIFDGGDQQPTVIIRDDWSAVGVDPTDTVIYYETLGGTVCVRPSNRVPIYAPRFGAVRQVAGIQLSERAVGPERVLAPVTPGRFEERNLASNLTLPVAPHGEEQIGLIDAFQDAYRGTPMDQVLPLYRMSEARVPFEYVDLFRNGLITKDELAVIGKFIQNAHQWYVPESISVEISNQQAVLIRDTQAAEEIYVYELPDKCAMRICKAASHTIANPGDIVSFTIRFDNAGVKPLGNAVILDSLSPRLDYIEGSQQSSVEVRFSTEPNDAGSVVLKWEIQEPIKPSDGGVISFDCRVR